MVFDFNVIFLLVVMEWVIEMCVSCVEFWCRKCC